MQEIERKWRCSGYPDISVFPNITLCGTYQDETSYLFVSEDLQIRVRKYKFDGKNIPVCILCVKIGNGMVRSEFEEKITYAAYTELLKSVPYPPVTNNTKHYRVTDADGHELKIYVALTDLKWWRAEVEFPCEQAANDFICPFPDWEEAPEMSMKNYWVRTRIQGGINNGE